MKKRHDYTDEDVEAVIQAAKDMAFQKPIGHFLLNPISSLPEPRKYLKQSLKERISGLMLAYISLATFVEDEEVEAITEEPKKSLRVYKRVMKRMDEYEAEIRSFLRELARSTIVSPSPRRTRAAKLRPKTNHMKKKTGAPEHDRMKGVRPRNAVRRVTKE